MSDPLVRVEGLTKHYPITEGVLKREVGRVRAVDGVDFEIRRGETLGLVGESGCGKSTAATTMLRIEEPTAGEVYFDGEPVGEYDKAQLKRFRRETQMIFQDPVSSFDPRMTMGESVGEPLRIHGVTDRERRRRIVTDLVERVGLEPAALDRYPHEFSGGQKQRLALARALVVNPKLIVADEPVSALDVSIQADILSLLREVQAEFDLSVLFISHDMGVVREVCDRIAVMYLGEIVEIGDAEAIFGDPQHPYTRQLLASVLPLDPGHERARSRLSGDVPSPSNPPAGCRFHTRCPEIIEPEGFEFEDGTFRAVMDLRNGIETEGTGPESIRQLAAAERDIDPGAVTDEQMAATLRREFDLPERLADPRAEETVSEAVEALVAGEPERAAGVLAETFQTPCEAREPELIETDGEQPAACHLHDSEYQPQR